MVSKKRLPLILNPFLPIEQPTMFALKSPLFLLECINSPAVLLSFYFQALDFFFECLLLLLNLLAPIGEKGNLLFPADHFLSQFSNFTSTLKNFFCCGRFAATTNYPLRAEHLALEGNKRTLAAVLLP